ncbi:MAG: hypothetical protein ACYC8T_22770 [Myxococcaceae bacterium]
MPSRPFVRIPALLLFALAGCTAPLPPGPPPENPGFISGVSDAGVSPEAFCGESSRVFCERMLACGEIDSVQRASCVAEYTEWCDRGTGKKLSAGVLLLDPLAARACFDRLSAGCGTLYDSPDECRNELLIRAGRQPGGTCSEHDDCTTGVCGNFDGGACPTCQPLPGLGQSCSGWVGCDPQGSWCPGALPDGGQVCQPLKASGSPCTSASECADHVCRYTPFLSPDGGTAPPAVCGAGRSGDGCRFDGDCAAGWYCRLGACAPRVPTGQPCTNREPNDGCLEPRATCLNGVCVLVPDYSLPLGAECDSPWQCQPQLACAGGRPYMDGGATSACVARSNLGDTCDSRDRTCPLGATCIYGKCAALLPAGVPCTSTEQCKRLLNCVPPADGGTERVCTPRAAVGESCGRSTQWPCTLDAYCALDGGSSGVCLPLKGQGASCTWSDAMLPECASGICMPRLDGGAACQECFP